jgi:AcrR family transcriptional regulator
VEAIREAARLAVEETSLRAVARAVGMSPMGLRHFLDGRAPYSATLRKLNVWYVLHQAERHGFSASAAMGAIALLLDGIPEPLRDLAMARVLRELWEVHVQAGSTPPGWLQELRRTAAAEEE